MLGRTRLAKVLGSLLVLNLLGLLVDPDLLGRWSNFFLT